MGENQSKSEVIEGGKTNVFSGETEEKSTGYDEAKGEWYSESSFKFFLLKLLPLYYRAYYDIY